ncbi:MAG: patatin-like phospholipase family protein, partial [Giesbergeria sp.]
IDQWRQALAGGNPVMGDAFASDAQIHVIQVNLRDASDELVRRRLLQVPTAFSIAQGDVSALIEAGGSVLRQSQDFQALLESLQSPASGAPSRP